MAHDLRPALSALHDAFAILSAADDERLDPIADRVGDALEDLQRYLQVPGTTAWA